MNKLFFLGIAVLLLSLTISTAFGQGEVVIEEEGSSQGRVGGGISIHNGDVGVDIRVQPGTQYRKRTTIRQQGNVNVYTYRPGCEPPCDVRYCYPPNHPCRDCNTYHSTPCPNP